MASSGSYDFSVSRDDLIKDAMLEIGALESGEAPTADETTDCARRLNMMIKSWVVKGYHLWCIQEAVLFQVIDQTSYRLGDAATDANWCAADDYVQTTLSVAAIAGAGSVTLTDGSDFTTGDAIGVVLDGGSIQWTTATMAGNVATLGANLTGAAASANIVFGYTSRLVRPLRLIKYSAYRRDINGNDQPIEIVGKPEYDLLTKKDQAGKTIQIAYLPYLTSGTLWTWPTADLSTDVVRFSCERPIQDFDTTADNPDFPIEASKALYLNLAAEICGMFGAPDELARLRSPDGESGLADQALLDWLAFDVENASVRIQPDIRLSRSGASRRW